MADWILLILVGLITYVLLQRSVARLSTVPWRILWVVMITPPTTVVLAQQIFQYELPPVLVLLLFLVSYITSVVLLRRGRLSAASKPTDSPSESPATTLSSNAKEKPATIPETIATALAHTPISEVPKDKLMSCFPWNVFYLQNVEYRPQAIICRGNLRGDPNEAYEQVRDNVTNEFGHRFLVVLQDGAGGKPFFALVPNPAARRTTPVESEQPVLAISLLLFTLLTTMNAGALAAGVNPDQIFHPQSWLRGIPYALAMIAILGTHELVRFVMAHRHHIKTSLPYFIPVPFALGTFGAFVQLKEPVPNRKVLFDLSIAGPIAGVAVALILLLVGLAFSTTSPAPIPVEGQPIMISFQKIDPSLSIILAILAKVVMGSRLGAAQVIDFHPLAFAGWLGLVVTALNLMPIGQLDGGHIVHAVYGQQMGANVGRVARLLVLLLALTIQPWLWIWALLLFFISSADEPALNDVTDLNEGRDLLGLFVLTLLVFIILPVPPFLQVWLGLG